MQYKITLEAFYYACLDPRKNVCALHAGENFKQYKFKLEPKDPVFQKLRHCNILSFFFEEERKTWEMTIE